MEKIETLTAEQIVKFQKYVEEWTKIDLSTEPADRPRAQAAIIKMYAVAGKAAPKIVWCGSPLSQVLARSALISLQTSVGISVRDSVGDGTWNYVRNKVQNQLKVSVRDSVWVGVRTSVRDGVGTSLGESVGESVLDNVFNSVRHSLKACVGSIVVDRVARSNLWISGQYKVRQHLRDSLGYRVLGNRARSHDADGLAYCKFLQTECGLDWLTSKLDGFWELSHSAGWALPHENTCFVSERPSQIHQTMLPHGGYQLHNEFGPAIAYRDGWAIYFLRGFAVSEQIVMRPESITLKQITNERNAEVRRIMMERYGYEKYLRESGAKLMDCCPQDHKLKGLSTAKLWKIRKITLLDVLNSTPEPDGTTKRYLIPVDGTLYGGRAGRECLAASASTWRTRLNQNQLVFERPEDYAPEFES